MEYDIEYGKPGKFTIISITDNKEAEKKSPINSEPPKKFRLNALYYLQDFTDNVSIAGLKFLGEEGRSLPERIFWAIVMIFAIILSAILVSQVFEKWQTSPVIVTFATAQTPLFNIPFPAVTICPETKTVKEIVNFTDLYIKVKRGRELEHDESSAFDDLALVCDLEQEEGINTRYYFDEELLDYLYKVSPDISNIARFYWRNSVLDFEDSNLITILTSEGICYTFNGLDKSEIFTENVYFPEEFFTSPLNRTSEWTIETGYKENGGTNGYPKRTSLAGRHGGLTVYLTENMQELDHACGDILKGFKVILHHPAEIPRVAENYFRVGINKDVVVAVKPNIVRTDEKLNNYASEDRQCYFENEKKLDFFKAYNQKNCLLECLTKFTLKFCGCVEFYMPRINSTNICGITVAHCTQDAKALFQTTKIINDTLGDGETLSENPANFEEDVGDQCDCLPSCHSIDFDVEISQENSNMYESDKIEKAINDYNDDPDDDNIYISKLMVHYKDMQFITSERHELYGYTDFWANVGGILGLFTGFSFITLFEILYYLSLRLMCNVKIFVIVTFATSSTPIYQIPFPAVTICPETKAVKEEVNFTDIYIKFNRGEELTASEYEVYNALSLICTLSEDEVNETADYLNEDKLLLLLEIAPYILDLADVILWKNARLNFTTANMIPILTAEGVCYTFNGLDRYFPGEYFKSPVNQKSEWTVEKGYKKNAGLNVYPRRTFLAGLQGGLGVRFSEYLEDLDYICGNVFKGFKVSEDNINLTASSIVYKRIKDELADKFYDESYYEESVEEGVEESEEETVEETVEEIDDDSEKEFYTSAMQIYFKDMEFITSERNELYGYTDFWANVGGILGLFTGFSFITLFEIFYYLSLRIMCNVKLFGKRFWSGSPNVSEQYYFNSDSF